MFVLGLSTETQVTGPECRWALCMQLSQLSNVQVLYRALDAHWIDFSRTSHMWLRSWVLNSKSYFWLHPNPSSFISTFYNTLNVAELQSETHQSAEWGSWIFTRAVCRGVNWLAIVSGFESIWWLKAQKEGLWSASLIFMFVLWTTVLGLTIGGWVFRLQYVRLPKCWLNCKRASSKHNRLHPKSG